MSTLSRLGWNTTADRNSGAAHGRGATQIMTVCEWREPPGTQVFGSDVSNRPSPDAHEGPVCGSPTSISPVHPPVGFSDQEQ